VEQQEPRGKYRSRNDGRGTIILILAAFASDRCRLMQIRFKFGRTLIAIPRVLSARA
jgi:hypothetical protein